MEENTPERWVSSLRFSLPLLKCAVLRGFYLPDFSGAPSLPEHEEGGCCSSTGLLGHKGNAHVVQAVPGPGQAAEMPMLFEFSGFLTVCLFYEGTDVLYRTNPTNKSYRIYGSS